MRSEENMLIAGPLAQVCIAVACKRSAQATVSVSSWLLADKRHIGRRKRKIYLLLDKLQGFAAISAAGRPALSKVQICACSMMHSSS